jgi:hypothetical protein
MAQSVTEHPDVAAMLEGLAKLREPFPIEAVGKLPRVTCSDCSKRNCSKHQKKKCGLCGAYVSTEHIHLDFVGHAEVTDRLLTVDPNWNWEPLARDIDPAVLAAAVAAGPEVLKAVIESSPPRFDRGADGQPIGLWIRLTICGVTRLGYGSVEPRAFDPEKQLIGDALRNSALRFGVALDLLSKSDLESQLGDNQPEPAPLPDGWMNKTEMDGAHRDLAARIGKLAKPDVDWCRTYRVERGWPMAVEPFSELEQAVAGFEEEVAK